MKKLLALLAFLPTLVFGATSTSVCIPDVMGTTGGDVLVFAVTLETAACAVAAVHQDPQRVYLVSSDLKVTQILVAMLPPDSGRIVATGPAMTARGLADEINAAIGVVLHELDDDENDATSDPILLDTHAVILSMARNYGWRIL